MRIETQRFGTISLDQDQLFLFPAGLIGMESLRDWALLPDLENESVAWLQSASRGDRALPLISPRAFFPDYRIQVSRRELTSLHLKPGTETYVLTTISGHSGKLTTNLRSPIVLNLSRRLGSQIITDNDYPLQQPVTTLAGATKVVRDLTSTKVAPKRVEAQIVAQGDPVPAFKKSAVGLFAQAKKSAA